jgi:Xaa-Pro aminopeptidase
MNSRFSSDFFVGNRQRLRALFTGTAPIVMTANGLLQRGGDTSYAFAQDASFWYLTGIEDPDIILVIDRDKEYLIVPGRSSSREKFDGVITDEVLISRSGIKDLYDEKEGWERLSIRLKKVKHAATIAPVPAYLEAYGMYTNPARATLVQKMKADNANLELLDLGMHISVMRMIKQPIELEVLQTAIDITNSTLKDVLRPSKLQKYGYEFELEADLTRGFRRRGASGHAFDPVIAGGARACQMHYITNNSVFSADELVILDVGAEVEHYSADIARTVTFGTPSRRQQTVHETVLEVQEFARNLLRPGILLREYENEVEVYMGEKLRELGLIKTINNENVRIFFPHRTSHFLGLNTHDAGDYDRPLEPGVVITVEPGIYIPEEGIGVRIEDDVLITANGNKLLSNKLPRTLV